MGGQPAVNGPAAMRLTRHDGAGAAPGHEPARTHTPRRSQCSSSEPLVT